MKIKGFILHSRKDFVIEHFGDEAWNRVLEASPENHREILGDTLLTANWYDFEIGKQLDLTIVDVLGEGAKQVFEDIGGEYAADIFDNAYYVATRTDGEKYMAEEYGTEFITLPPEELARWDELVKPLQEEFLADLEAKGLPAHEAYEEYHRLAAEYTFK